VSRIGLTISSYWDQERQLWSFCPVAVPTSTADVITQTSEKSDSPASTTALGIVSNRQDRLSGTSLTPLATTGTVSFSTESPEPSSESLGDQNPSLVSLGPYKCSGSLTLLSFSNLLLSYIKNTQNTLDAHIMYYVVNIHAAASASAPTEPPPIQTRLPPSSLLLGSLLSNNLSTYIYTRNNLFADRANLNASWFTVPERYRPSSDYYRVTQSSSGVFSTEDGWPTEAYITFSSVKRAIISFGNIDPEMQGTNTTSDESILFPENYTRNNQSDVVTNSAGVITKGCLFEAGAKPVNSSWASISSVSGINTSDSLELPSLYTLSSNLTDCGISLILNKTLSGVSAAQNYELYQKVSQGTVWSWAADEPRNMTFTDTETAVFRCATSIDGRWYVRDCNKEYYAACKTSPFNWTISTGTARYKNGQTVCPSPYTFSVPQSGLENAYLTQAIQDSMHDYGHNGVLVALNSFNMEGCWVTGSENATCPYNSDDLNEFTRERTIVVPTVAAIIILVISGLTLFSKLAGNRRTTKRIKKRANNGYRYEGVPS
jgi:hypothetical protein